jgi:hypothetical protein
MTTRSIETLRQLVAPPEHPLYNDGKWEAVENDLGVQLPTEYKYLMETFGQGEFVGQVVCSGLFIASYLGPCRPSERGEGFSAYFRTIDPIPYALYPDNPGLLGFGSYGDKDTIAWNTTGTPERWNIIYHDPETGFHDLHDMTFIEFVISVLEESSPLHRTGVIRTGNMKGPHTFCPEP